MTTAVIESGYRTSYYVKRRDRSGEHEGDMEGTTHAATGFLAGTGVGLLVHAGSHPVGHLAVAHNIGIDLLFGAVAAGLALLPDADHPKASFAYSAGFVSRGLSHLMAVVFGGHRAGMHSLFGMALFALATEAGAVWFPNRYALVAVAVVLAMTTGAGLAATGFARHGLVALFWGALLAGLAVWAVRGDLWWLVLLGMGLHIAEDMCTGHGVALLWPFYLGRIGGDGRQPARSRQPAVRRPAGKRPDSRPAGRPAPAATAAPTAPFRTGKYKPGKLSRAMEWASWCGDCLDGSHGECTDRHCQCTRGGLATHPKRPGGPAAPRPPLPDEPPFLWPGSPPGASLSTRVTSLPRTGTSSRRCCASAPATWSGRQPGPAWASRRRSCRPPPTGAGRWPAGWSARRYSARTCKIMRSLDSSQAHPVSWRHDQPKGRHMKYTLDTWQSGTSRRGLSVPVAAGILAAGETVVVGAIAAEWGRAVNLHDAVPGLCLSLYPNPIGNQRGEEPFTVHSSATDLGPDEAATLQLIIARADAIRVMAEKLLAGEGPGEYEDTPAEAPAVDRVVTEVAVALGRYAELDSNPMTLTHDETLRLARHAMDRLCLIRDRDGIDPLPHAGAPAVSLPYDPVQNLVVIALSVARSPGGMSTPAALGLQSLHRTLGLDGSDTLETWLARVRAAVATRREA